MAAAKEIISGAGTRYAIVAPLGSDGLPNVDTTTAVPVQGTVVEGIQTVSVTSPTPRRVNHRGNDYVFAQDTLPPTEISSFSFNTGKTNMRLDATVSRSKIRTIGNAKFMAGDTDKMGDEPQVFFAVYRQALDTDDTSDTFGQLRQWNMRTFPSTRIVRQAGEFGEAEVATVYDATPTPVKQTSWGENFDETNWGVNRGTFVDGVVNYHPRFNYWLGNGTLASFQLSHPPANANELLVWNATQATQLSPSSVDLSSTNPAFTLSAAPGLGDKIVALIMTDEPGET